MFTWIKNTILYWPELWKEFRIWRIFKKTADQNTAMLNEKGLRVDWLGRIYTVVNLPEEVQTASQEIQQAYVLQKISEFGSSMMNIGLGDVVYPEIQRINGAPAWLVVLWPSFESLTFLRIISYLFRTTLLVSLFYILIKIVYINFDKIVHLYNLIAN